MNAINESMLINTAKKGLITYISSHRLPLLVGGVMIVEYILYMEFFGIDNDIARLFK